MCVPKPKAPKVEPIPDRRASVLPDGGDPSMRPDARRRNRVSSAAAMIFTQQGKLGMPNTARPSLGA